MIRKRNVQRPAVGSRLRPESSTTSRFLLKTAWALAPIVGLGACDAVIGASDRELDSSIVCDDDGCVCAEGRGDCDDEPDNGCETDLSKPENCGACGAFCANGKCESFTCACDPGRADCDGDPTTVCETNFDTDGSHCGSCARSCEGGTCEGGLCAPQAIPGAIPAYDFVLVDDEIYFTGYFDPGLYQVSVDGGTATQIGDDTKLGALLRADETTLYWTTFDEVLATPLGGGPTVVLASQVAPDRDLEVGGGQVYWTNYEGLPSNPGTPEDLHLFRTPATPGGTVEDLAVLGPAKYLHDLGVTATHIYWSDVFDIFRIAHDKTATSLFSSVQTQPTFFEADESALLFAGTVSGTFRSSLIGTGDALQLADEPGYGVLIADKANVYFTTFVAGQSAVSLWRVSKTGTGLTKLAVDPAMVWFEPIALDDAWVYWMSVDHQVVRVPK